MQVEIIITVVKEATLQQRHLVKLQLLLTEEAEELIMKTLRYQVPMDPAEVQDTVRVVPFQVQMELLVKVLMVEILLQLGINKVEAEVVQVRMVMMVVVLQQVLLEVMVYLLL